MNSVYGSDSRTATTSDERPPRLRCIVEIIGGEVAVYPIANCDSDEKAILDALQFVVADGGGR